MEQELLHTVEIDPDLPAQRTVIWLHGLGTSGHDFLPVVAWLRLPAELAVRFVFPHAPSIPVSINGGLVMPAWYDIRPEHIRPRADPDGVLQAQEWIRGLIAREEGRGVASSSILLVGFSQGGSLALHAALRHPKRLAGAAGLSCFQVRAEALERERTPANADLRLFLAHGRTDPVVPMQYAEEAAATLRGLGHAVEWHSYAMEHQVLPEEIVDLGRWLRAVL